MASEQNCFQSQPKINVVSTLNFIDESMLTNWINVYITLTDVVTLFQHVSTLNQRWVFAGSYSLKKVFFDISQNSQKNTCARVPFLIKLQVWGLPLVIQKNICFQMLWAEGLSNKD